MKNSDGDVPRWRRYRDLLRGHRAEDVSDELRFHLEMRMEEARRAGASEQEARRETLERFGELPVVEAELLAIAQHRERKRRHADWIGDLKRDVAFASRNLRRNPGFAATAILTLALAIGANTAVFSVVNALLVQPLPYRAPAQLVSTWGWSTGELLALRSRLRSFSDVAGYSVTSANLDDPRGVSRVAGSDVSANFFSLLGSRPLLGRTFQPGEDRRGNTDVVVLSEGFWRSRYGGDPRVIGRRVLMDGVPHTVVGVMPASFAFPDAQAEYWRPFTIDPANVVNTWANGGHKLIARLVPSATVTSTRQELRRVAPSLRHDNPVWDPGPKYGLDADVQPLRDSVVGSTRPVLLLLFACTLLVLLIACVNVANLLLARANARGRELAVRAALGGGRGRMIRQLLTESVVLSLAGAAVGVALAFAGLGAVLTIVPPGVPQVSSIHVNATALLFAVGISVLAGIGFGVLPAVRVTRGGADPGQLRGARGGTSAGHQRLSSMLVVSEVALAVVLAIAAQLLVRSFAQLQSVGLGFSTEQVVTARLTPVQHGSADTTRVFAFYDEVLARAAALPGVISVGASNELPLETRGDGLIGDLAVRIQGQFEDIAHGLPTTDAFQIVTPGYFRTMQIPVAQGRLFTSADGRESEPVAVISEAMARRFWPGQSAIGKRIGYPWPGAWLTVVGVVRDVRIRGARDTSDTEVYVPFAQRASFFSQDMTLVVRTAADPVLVGRELREVVSSVDRSVPVSSVRSMREMRDRYVATPRFTMLLVGGFAALALVLGAIGIYGVMSYVVTQRARELSLRTALGATSGDLLRMVVRHAASLAIAGALLGVVAGFLAVGPLRSMLYGISATDPFTFVSVPAFFVLVATAASLTPAWRAARVDPASALREG
jgi:predicted permease